MSFIVPYENTIVTSDGAFITPNNKIILVDSHEIFSYEYCNGPNSFLLGNSDMSKSKLTKEQLELYKLWLKSTKNPKSIHSDFMIYVLGFDKIQTIMKRTIITTTNHPYIKYYNYYLMDWRIEQMRKKRYNKEIGNFEFETFNEWINTCDKDREIKEELDEIKSKILKKDRTPYLK